MATIETMQKPVFRVELSGEEAQYLEALMGITHKDFDRSVGCEGMGERLYRTFNEGIKKAGLAEFETGHWGVRNSD